MTTIKTLAALYVVAQCLVSAPITAPRANQLIINLPSDGGSQGCTASATSVAGLQPSGVYPIGNAKCSTARQIADQIVANDNGWNDGGTP